MPMLVRRLSAAPCAPSASERECAHTGTSQPHDDSRLRESFPIPFRHCSGYGLKGSLRTDDVRGRMHVSVIALRFRACVGGGGGAALDAGLNKCLREWAGRHGVAGDGGLSIRCASSRCLSSRTARNAASWAART